MALDGGPTSFDLERGGGGGPPLRGRREVAGWPRHGGPALDARNAKALLAVAAAGWGLLLLGALKGGGGAPGCPPGAGVARADPRNRLGARPRAAFAGLDGLVVVAGHGVITSDFTAVEDNASWFLEAYQQVPGQAASFVRHIEAGVAAAAADPRSLLLFSGGETRAAAGPESEGGTYWKVADLKGWWGHEGVRARALAEEGARDSLENLLFSLCRFHEVTGRYPARVAVVSYDFKRDRFEQHHRRAARFPAGAFRYVGTPAPEAAAAGAREGERKTLATFAADPYGCLTPALVAKREQRDPFASAGRYVGSCPELQGLLQHCGRECYAGPLPWAP